MTPRHRKARAARKRKELKDRLIQTRVPQGLESTLKEEAEKRRLSVSHLIRNVLEDAFHLVGDVVSSAGRIAEDSVELAGQVAEEAGRIAKTVREAADEVRAPAGATPAGAKPAGAKPVGVTKVGATKVESGPRLQVDDADADKSNLRARATARRRAVPEDVLGWQALVIHRPSNCFSCGRDLEKGDAAHLAFTAMPQPPLWLCPDCFAKESGPA